MALSKHGPPADLHLRELPVKEVDGEAYRISLTTRTAAGVIYYGKNRTERFDDPDAKYGVCYLGQDVYAAFIEVFGQAREIVLDISFVYARALSLIRISKPVRLVDITGEGAAWIGAAGEVSAGDHALSQEWSRQLYLHPEKVDGIFYRCRHDSSRLSIALFDRRSALLAVEEFRSWSEPSIQSLLGELLDHYHFSIKT
jgi:hypothetical protein